METKATLDLDDHEMELIIQALTFAADEELYKANKFKANLYRMISRKVADEKVRYQDRQLEILAQKYGLKKKSLP